MVVGEVKARGGGFIGEGRAGLAQAKELGSLLLRRERANLGRAHVITAFTFTLGCQGAGFRRLDGFDRWQQLPAMLLQRKQTPILRACAPSLLACLAVAAVLLNFCVGMPRAQSRSGSPSRNTSGIVRVITVSLDARHSVLAIICDGWQQFQPQLASRRRT